MSTPTSVPVLRPMPWSGTRRAQRSTVGHVDRDRRPALQRRPLLARHDRQRRVAVVEEPERCGTEGRGTNADGAAAGRLRGLLVGWWRSPWRGAATVASGAPETHSLEGEHVLDPVKDAAVQLQPGRSLAHARASDRACASLTRQRSASSAWVRWRKIASSSGVMMWTSAVGARAAAQPFCFPGLHVLDAIRHPAADL